MAARLPGASRTPGTMQPGKSTTSGYRPMLSRRTCASAVITPAVFLLLGRDRRQQRRLQRQQPGQRLVERLVRGDGGYLREVIPGVPADDERDRLRADLTAEPEI